MPIAQGAELEVASAKFFTLKAPQSSKENKHILK